MRRRLLVLTLLAALPFEAAASPAFCEALNRLVSAAQSRFDWLPPGRHLIPGSLGERHGTVEGGDGEPRGIIYATMLLQREVAECLPNANGLGTVRGAGAALARWQTPYADIGLRRVDGTGDVAEAMIELSVASRW